MKKYPFERCTNRFPYVIFCLEKLIDNEIHSCAGKGDEKMDILTPLKIAVIYSLAVAIVVVLSGI